MKGCPVARCTVAAVVSMGIATSGCGTTAHEAARLQGATDLDCPAPLVVAYRAGSGLYVARGCKRWIEYACSYKGGHAHCWPRPGVRPEPLP